MSDIPEHIWEAARSLRNAVCWQSNSSVEPIAAALLAAEQRGREEAAKIADAHAECERDCGDVIAASIRSRSEGKGE